MYDGYSFKRSHLKNTQQSIIGIYIGAHNRILVQFVTTTIK